MEWFPPFLQQQLMAVEDIWLPGGDAPATWSAGVILCHGTSPSAAVAACDPSTQLIHLMPQCNRMNS
eukprot:2134820-Karenia_brevis.AAC.1